MKQGIHQFMRVSFDILLDDVEKIEFRFKQSNSTTEIVRDVVYPSDETKRVSGKNEIDIDWDVDESSRFNYSQPVRLDTRITLNGSVYNPETEIINFSIKESLFRQVSSDASENSD